MTVTRNSIKNLPHHGHRTPGMGLGGTQLLPNHPIEINFYRFV